MKCEPFKRDLCWWRLYVASVLLFVCALTGIECGHTSDATAVPATRILFIGNSFTSVNNLPMMFQQLATSGGKSVYVDQVSPPGWNLVQHAADGSAALAKIRGSQWNFVVLQEQSQIPAYENLRPEMYRGSRILNEAVRKSPAKTVFFLTWGYRNGDPMNNGVSNTGTFEGMQEQLRIGYSGIATELSAMTCPVGTAWLNAVHQNPKINLWVADNKHPRPEGTYLAASAFYATLFRESPVGLKYTGRIDPNTALFLQQVAAKTCLTSPVK